MRRRTKGRIKRFEERNRLKEELPQEEDYVVKHRSSQNRNVSRKLFLIIAAVLMIVLFTSIKNIFELQAEKRSLTEQKEALTLEKESLENELKNASDEEYIEEQARIQLKLIKPGEILYILEDDNKDNNKDKENKESKEDEKEDD